MNTQPREGSEHFAKFWILLNLKFGISNSIRNLDDEEWGKLSGNSEVNIAKLYLITEWAAIAQLA